jgi:hypothetical protein
MTILYEKEITGLLQDRANALVEKHTHSEQYGQAVALLTVLMAQHLNSSSSFENKIQALLRVAKEKGFYKRVKLIHRCYLEDEIAFKKYRDLDEFYKAKIMEYQSRRKCETGIL